jgi:hypothetical protein
MKHNKYHCSIFDNFDPIELGLRFDSGIIAKRIALLNKKYNNITKNFKRTKIIKEVQIIAKRSNNKQIKTILKLKRKMKKKHRSNDSPTVQEAMKRTDWPQWKEAIEKEYQQMIDDKVYYQIDYNKIPINANIIGSMIILQLKRKSNGEIDKYKARLVALGNNQH